MAAQNKVTLGYWNCRGLAHASILMLEYLEKPYEFQSPPNDLVGPPPTYAKTKWLEAKHEILKAQCGKFRIFLSLIFYVKSILETLEVLKLPFLQFLGL